MRARTPPCPVYFWSLSLTLRSSLTYFFVLRAVVDLEEHLCAHCGHCWRFAATSAFVASHVPCRGALLRARRATSSVGAAGAVVTCDSTYNKIHITVFPPAAAAARI
ncbi:hypothetical protein EVAR_25463_1 [Eumeta japonica]|uniref:Secreted protein n=1 Tax=Eumeta variegata TaxID=151549 RepID=A0A4C1VM98_EUMVA|nr:hypothetical protein EVAR_25463_1 [Eumeta japonica]